MLAIPITATAPTLNPSISSLKTSNSANNFFACSWRAKARNRVRTLALSALTSQTICEGQVPHTFKHRNIPTRHVRAVVLADGICRYPNVSLSRPTQLAKPIRHEIYHIHNPGSLHLFSTATPAKPHHKYLTVTHMNPLHRSLTSYNLPMLTPRLPNPPYLSRRLTPLLVVRTPLSTQRYHIPQKRLPSSSPLCKTCTPWNATINTTSSSQTYHIH